MDNNITFRINKNYIVDNNMVGPNLSYNIYQLFISIKNRISKYGYNEMCNFVINNITELLTSAVDKNPNSLKIITDRDFLIAFNMTNLNLTKEYINRFNRVYRAYMINPEKNAIFSQECANLMYTIALKYNREVVNEIVTKDLVESNALWIVINRYSSTDERRNIRRAVRAMQHIDRNIMDENMITRIFTKLFKDQLTNLFCAVMTDRFDEFDDYNEQYVYSAVNIAILRILNTMDYDEIKDILMLYGNELKESGTLGRFSLNSISPDDYRKVVDAKDEVEKVFGVKIY
jgi:hypothetical protein